MRYMTKEEIEKQMRILGGKPRLCVAVAIMIYAGLRRSEMLWLTSRDIDRGPRYGVIRIVAKQVKGIHWQPKTVVERSIPISEALAVYLDQYEEVRPPGEFYIPEKKGRLWHPDNFNRRLRNHNRRFGLDYSPLIYRHTFGSQLAMKGESLYKISALTGKFSRNLQNALCCTHYRITGKVGRILKVTRQRRKKEKTGQKTP